MKITVKNFQKQTKVVSVPVKKAVNAALSALGLHSPAGQISIYFVGDKMIKALNSRYLGHNRATDVLAFDVRRAPNDGLLADIVISVDTAKRNARIFSTSLSHELCLYAVHGILHLSGYDDKTAAQRKRMQKKSETILKAVLPDE
ncbi:MAG: rRNA maturation RNase YbeY [Candidatus Omnitrophota bacterium]|nr:rRNA maturation RNase YbeY [Candidatus Omnitrophota bacterium]